METLYIKSTPWRSKFYVGTDSNRTEAKLLFASEVKPLSNGGHLLSVGNSHGSGESKLLPTAKTILATSPLTGEIILRDKIIGSVHIEYEMYAPLVIGRGTAGFEITVEREPFQSPYAPIVFKSSDRGYVADARETKYTMKELWLSRFGFGRVTWGSIDIPDVRDQEADTITHFVMAALELIWKPRHESTGSTGS